MENEQVVIGDESFRFFYKLIEEKPCNNCQLFFKSIRSLEGYCSLPKNQNCEAKMITYKQVKAEQLNVSMDAV